MLKQFEMLQDWIKLMRFLKMAALTQILIEISSD